MVTESEGDEYGGPCELNASIDVKEIATRVERREPFDRQVARLDLESIEFVPHSGHFRIDLFGKLHESLALLVGQELGFV
jgi:hypothetical protein